MLPSSCLAHARNRWLELYPSIARTSQGPRGLNGRLNVEQSSAAISSSHDRQIQRPFPATFALGDRVRKKSGAAWQGRIVGWYSTQLTPEGYAVESEAHPGSVQIYPVAALERVA
jgi:dihydrofolate reductase (trimethoprim resistance protein)